MEVTLLQNHLAKALGVVSRSASARANLPVLANICLRATQDTLQMAATNLESASTSTLPAAVTKQGELTVPAKLFQEFIQNLPAGETVSLVQDGTSLTISCKGYSSTLHGISAEEFPELPGIDESTAVQYQIETSLLKKALNQVLFVCSRDTSRPVLTGVYWHSFEGWLYLAATDGYRLAERRMIETKSELAVIVPYSTLQEVLRIAADDIDEIAVLVSDSQIRFRAGTVELTSRLIEGKYPDYRQLIPANTEVNVKLPHSELQRVAKIASLFTREAGGSITIDVDSDASRLSIRSVASELGENTSELEVVSSTSGSVSLNSRYLTEVLSVIDQPLIQLGFSGKLAPIKLQPTAADTKTSDYTHIIMPLKS